MQQAKTPRLERLSLLAYHSLKNCALIEVDYKVLN